MNRGREGVEIYSAYAQEHSRKRAELLDNALKKKSTGVSVDGVVAGKSGANFYKRDRFFI